MRITFYSNVSDSIVVNKKINENESEEMENENDTTIQWY